MGYQDDLARESEERRGGDEQSESPVRPELGERQSSLTKGPSTGSGRTDYGANASRLRSRRTDDDNETRHPGEGRGPLSSSQDDGSGDQSKEIPDQGYADDDFPPPPDQNTAAMPLTVPADYRPRADGWSRRKMVDFLEALAETCSVAQAAEVVSMSRSAAYRLRTRLSGTPFDLAWEVALESGLRQVAHAALDRAVNGVVQPVFYKGEQVGERRVYNERLTWMMLQHAETIGRTHAARTEMISHWDGMLYRVEHGMLDWDHSAPDGDA